jgi:hypothetical protein
MTMTTCNSRALVLAASVAGLLALGSAQAKLPPPSDEAKAKMAEANAKTAHGNAVANYQLCKSMDRVAAVYVAEAKKAGKDVKPATATAPCADPGPFAYTPPSATPPLEAAGAHSPAKTATAPPNSKTPQAEQGAKKP